VEFNAMARLTSRAPAVARGGRTINEWCQRWGVSRASFYIMKKKKRGPRVTQAGDRSPRISEEADREWAQKYTEAE
jgi:predicted DNA-binding transcriptional regulator AlpA